MDAEFEHRSPNETADRDQAATSVNRPNAKRSGHMTKAWILLVAACSVAGFAGCTTPQESGTGDNTTRGTSGMVTPEYILVNGLTYECDDTINIDGICDAYELDEGDADDGPVKDITANPDGTLSVSGYLYRCDNVDRVDVDIVDTTDTTGECERYGRAE